MAALCTAATASVPVFVAGFGSQHHARSSRAVSATSTHTLAGPAGRSTSTLGRTNRWSSTLFGRTLKLTQIPSKAGIHAQSLSAESFLNNFVDYLKKLVTPTEVLEEQPESEEMDTGPRKTVLVAGATGRTGRHVVAGLLAKGHNAVCMVASPERATEILFTKMGLKDGKNGKADLRVVEGDVADAASLEAALEGCDAVICCVGGRFNPQAPMMERDAVDYLGVKNLAQAAAKVLGTGAEREEIPLVEFAESAGEEGSENGSLAAAAAWKQFDDVIMGGLSESSLKVAGGTAVFEGEVRVEGGGFCGTRVTVPNGPLELADFDGLTLRVKGDGQRYKVNLKPKVVEQSEFQYQACFDTVQGQWVTVDIPFDRFRPVMRARVVEDAAPLDKNDIGTVGIVLSRFQYDGWPNPLFTPGNFRLEVEKIGAYRSPRPQFVLMSAAAVEKNVRVRTPEQREKSIPIVKLNPGNILHWKLAGEDAVRASGLRYAVVRAVGLTDKDGNAIPADTLFPLQVAQGDVVTGIISREEVAEVLVEALDSPHTALTTFEVKRDELAQGLPMENWVGLFQSLRHDQRPPFVSFSPPPRLDVPNEEE